MPKKIRNVFYKNLTFEKLLSAHTRARRHKGYKGEVIQFEMNLENNLINLLNKIRSGKYRLGQYFSFKVYEPKERIIKALPYVDRIVHQWYVEEFIKPYIVPKFIDTSFACLADKGTHKAVEQLQTQLKTYHRQVDSFWILKCDIRKFFYNINPNILYNILCKYIEDKALLDFTRLLIFDNRNDSAGIPIGNYTSQFFANIYLTELDYFVKRTLKIKFYNRYMDDFVILAKTKEECIYIKSQIESFLKNNLELELNDKSKYYPYSMGVNYCGYRIFTTHKLLRNSSKKKIKKNIKKWNKLYSNKTLDIPKAMQSLNSWLGHSGHCNSYKLQNKVIESCNFLLTNKTYQDIEKHLISCIEKF